MWSTKILLSVYITKLILANSDGEANSTISNYKHTTEMTTTESYEFGDRLVEDLKGIAYYLRQHKFNEYDRRYITDEREVESSKTYFKGFPKPPLRSLHWEVHKNCEASFLQCVAYLTKRIMSTALRRNDDTSVVIEDQKWHSMVFQNRINETNLECKRLWGESEERADPFEGPIERFQWRVTASYFMCLYTLKGTPDLEHLNEVSCDNHANCLNPYFGPHLNDKRADDSIPFNCAKYSFCPDPCCPIYHIKNFDDCWRSPENPCFEENERGGDPKCYFNASHNTEFKDIILNQWNVSCTCPQPGFKWSSLYGICIDIDECEENIEPCQPVSEACLNIAGSYKCVCKWGYTWDKNSNKCEYSKVLDLVVVRRSEDNENDEENATQSFFQRFFDRAKEKFIKNRGGMKSLTLWKYFLLVLYFIILI